MVEQAGLGEKFRPRYRALAYMCKSFDCGGCPDAVPSTTMPIPGLAATGSAGVLAGARTVPTT